MGKSSPSPQKPEMSEQEKTQIAASKAEWDHYKENYRPIEKTYLADSERDHSDRAVAQGKSQVMREGTDGMRTAALGGRVSKAGSAVGDALSKAGTNAELAERQERDARMAGAVGVGRDMATDTQRSLSGLARAGASSAIGEMHNKLKVDSARSAARAQMVGSLAGAGTAMYTGGAFSSQKKPNTATTQQNQAEWAPPPIVRR